MNKKTIDITLTIPAPRAGWTVRQNVPRHAHGGEYYFENGEWYYHPAGASDTRDVYICAEPDTALEAVKNMPVGTVFTLEPERDKYIFVVLQKGRIARVSFCNDCVFTDPAELFEELKKYPNNAIRMHRRME